MNPLHLVLILLLFVHLNTADISNVPYPSAGLCSKDGHHDDQHREVVVKPQEIEVQEREIHIVIEEKDSNLEITAKVENTIELRYKDDTLDDEIFITIDKIIEFVDDSNDGFTNEPILSSIDLEGITWNNFVCGCPQIDSSDVNQCSILSSDGSVVFVLFFSETTYKVGSQPIYPTWIKFNFEIHNYVFTSNTSILAAHTTIYSKTKSSVSDTHDEEVHANNWESLHSEHLSFSWETDAKGPGGQFIKVVSSPIGDVKKNTHSVYYSFLASQVDTIVWDPALGTFSPSTITPWGIFGVVAAVLVGASLITASVLHLRNKHNNSEHASTHLEKLSDVSHSDPSPSPNDDQSNIV